MTPREDQDARRAQEWIRGVFASLSPERRSRRSYSLTFVSKVLKRPTDEVRALVESGALPAGRTPSGRLVFSIDDLLNFAGQGTGADSMRRSTIEIPSLRAELAANVLAGGEVLEVSWQDPFTGMLVAAGRLEPDPDSQNLRFRDLLNGAVTLIELARDANGHAVMGCFGCDRPARQLYRAQRGLLLCLRCAGFRVPTDEEFRRATELQETIGPPPGLPGADSPEPA